MECGRYIERNPIKAGLCKDPVAHAYSSYSFYSQGQGDDLLSVSPAYLALSDSEEARMAIYTELVAQRNISEEVLLEQQVPV